MNRKTMLTNITTYEIIHTWIRRVTLGMDGESGRLFRPATKPGPRATPLQYTIPTTWSVNVDFQLCSCIMIHVEQRGVDGGSASLF